MRNHVKRMPSLPRLGFELTPSRTRRACAVLTIVVVAILVIASSVESVGRKKLLVLTHVASLYKHDMLPFLEQVVPELGKAGGFDVTSLQGHTQDADELDLSMISAAYLAQFDGVLMSTIGELPLNDEQRWALIDFVKGGKGFVGVHQVAVTLYTFPPFGELVGGYVGPNLSNQAQDPRPAVMRVEDRTHPATRMIPDSWSLRDEIYSFVPAGVIGPTNHPTPVGFSRDRVHVLLSLDTQQTDMTNRPEPFTVGGDYPQAWWQEFGSGRAFYTALGHRSELWTSNQVFRAHITGGIRWALRLED